MVVGPSQQRSDLRHACLSGAKLVKANLTGACLNCAYQTAANLGGENLTKAVLPARPC